MEIKRAEHPPLTESVQSMRVLDTSVQIRGLGLDAENNEEDQQVGKQLPSPDIRQNTPQRSQPQHHFLQLCRSNAVPAHPMARGNTAYDKQLPNETCGAKPYIEYSHRQQRPGSLEMDTPEHSNRQHLEELAEDTKKWNKVLLTKLTGQQTEQPTKPRTR